MVKKNQELDGTRAIKAVTGEGDEAEGNNRFTVPPDPPAWFVKLFRISMNFGKADTKRQRDFPLSMMVTAWAPEPVTAPTLSHLHFINLTWSHNSLEAHEAEFKS